MKDYKLYTYVSILFTLLFCIVSIGAISLLLKNETINILDHSINSLKNEALVMAEMSTKVMTLDPKKENLIPVLQKTIANSQTNITFLSVINWTGDYVSYPNITKVGQNASKENSINYEEEINGLKLYAYLKKYDILDNENLNNEIIKLHAINNSDLLIACHIKVNEVNLELKNFKTRISLTFLALGLILLLLVNAMIRVISNYYSKMLESRVLELEFSAQNLVKLNESFSNYQEKLLQSENETANNETTTDEPNEGPSKERFLTYVRNELLSIPTIDIAYIYVENTITYIIRKDGKLSTSNETLDKIYTTLDKKIFFKANRQFIISISSIKKITKFENSKLKLEVNPVSEIDIVIGKNKASSFKQWLDL